MMRRLIETGGRATAKAQTRINLACVRDRKKAMHLETVN